MYNPTDRIEQTATIRPFRVRSASSVGTSESTDSLPCLKHDMNSNPYMVSSTSLEPVLDANKDDDLEPIGDPLKTNFELSTKRWFILFAMGIFGLSIALSCDTSPILKLILQLLGLKIDQYLYIHQVFYYAMAVMAMPIAWFIDKHGIKRAIYAAAGMYVLCCSIKALLYSPGLAGWHSYRMYYYVIGSLIGTQVSSIYFMLPLKVSETWFSASERSVAWTIMISQVDLGVCIASFLYPRIMSTLEDIKILAYINIGAVITTAIVCLACVTSDAPKNPPSERMVKASKEKELPFKVSIKRIITNKDVVLHLVHSTIIESCVICISNVLQDILISAGHSKIFAGNLMSINAFVSIIMLIVMASLVHKVSNITRACKLGSVVQLVLYILYLTTLILRAPGWIVVSASILLTICKCWTIPNLTNMTAHLACGLVSQATIVGFSITMTVIVTTVIQLAFIALIDLHHKNSDYTYSLIFLCSICAINEIIYQLLFRGESGKEQTEGIIAPPDQQDIESRSN